MRSHGCRDVVAVHLQLRVHRRVLLNQPVVTQLPQKVTTLANRVRRVQTSVEIPDLTLLLGNLVCRSRSLVHQGTLELELISIHVVLISSLDRSGIKPASPPEERAHADETYVMNRENSLSVDKLLLPEELSERSTSQVGDLEPTLNRATLASDFRNEILRTDVRGNL